MECKKCVSVADIKKAHAEDQSGESVGVKTVCPKDSASASSSVVESSLSMPVMVSVPVEPYKTMAECKTAKKYIESQRAYQNSFIGHCFRSVMTEHSSVGFEFEFTGHSIFALDSHVALGSSGALSALFGICFELESDSGQIIEIGMPPFLIPRIEGKHNKEEIAAVFACMKDAMLSIKRVAVNDKHSLDKLLCLVEQEGIGDKWSKKTQRILEVCEPTSDKAKGDNVYSQMNISMSAIESADLITASREWFAEEKDWNECEKSFIGDTYRTLENLHNGKQAAVIHINKALVNTLAIPSLVYPRRNGNPVPENMDYSSMVKEMASVWVKDSPANILATLAGPGDREELKQHAEFAFETVIKPKLNTLIGYMRVDEEGAVGRPFAYEKEQWAKINTVFQGEPEWICEDTRSKLLVLGKTVAISFEPVLTRLDEWGKLIKNDDYREFDDLVKEGFLAVEVGDESVDRESTRASFYADRYRQIKEAIDTACQKAVAEASTQTVYNDIEKEVTHMIGRLGGGAVDFGAHSFANETFGEGFGVRKDTFVKYFKSECPSWASGMPELVYNVVEIRSDLAVKKYLGIAVVV
ncbi:MULTISPECIES: hypothetical protein [unclassified Pseudomonas]